MQALTEPREVAGDIKRVEDAGDTGQLFKLAADLEETVWLSNRDKLKLREFVDRSLDAIDVSRREPCAWYQFGCKRQRARK